MTGPAEGDLLARQDGQWWQAEGHEVTPVALEDLLATLPATGGVGGPTVDLADGDLVEPTWLVIGQLSSRGLRGEDLAGNEVLLDAIDLRVLEDIEGAQTVGALDGDPGQQNRRERLARLVAAGALRLVDAGLPVDERPAAAPPPAPRVSGPSGDVHPGGPAGRVPVYAIWHPQVGPVLSLGLLTAAARQHDDGRLNDTFEIRRPETAASFLDDLTTRPPGPAVLLCSDYIWSVAENLEAAHAGRAINRDLIVVHGGPSSPKYEGDALRFLDDHGDVAHVLTRGEGEELIGELLTVLARTLPELDGDELASIGGLTYRHPATGAIVRTPDRERLTDPGSFPSPYLTGEFDHIPPDAWNTCLSIETNRGCPYGCTFCDWGSATLARIRKFDLDRAVAEVQWAADRGVNSINIADANFGIMARDVETAERIAEIRARTGYPRLVSFYPAKNTTRHLTKIMAHLHDAGAGTTASISLQSSDPETLQVLDRSNISTEHYVALAADYRRRGVSLTGDFLLGAPGQTYDSYRRDLQFSFDHEIMARTWQVNILPNAPMNAPEYRALHRIETEGNRVVATATFTREDRERMLRFRDVDIVAERLGVLRHVLRWLQWDHGLPATDVLDRLLHATEEDPAAWPLLTWVLTHFERFATAPVGWHALYAEVRAIVTEVLGVPAGSDLDTVLNLQLALMPRPGRRFPDTIALDHDYVAYLYDATDGLYRDGAAGRPPHRLSAYGPTTFTVTADPLGLCVDGVRFAEFGDRDLMETDWAIGANSANELLSPLLRPLPHAVANGLSWPRPGVPEERHEAPSVPVELGSRP